MNTETIDTLRVITVTLVTIFVIAAPFVGFMYGTTCAVNTGDFTIVSPLEFVLVSLSAKTVLINLIVPTLAVILVIVVFGRFFCGWICPVGILLEYSHAVTERKKKRGLGNLDWIGWKNREKYVILLAVFAASLLFSFAAPYLFSPPGVFYRTIIYFTLQGIIGADLIVLLLIFVLDMLAIRFGRTWCNTLCPLGALISLLSVINLVKPKVDQEICIDSDSNCLNCERICPMRIAVTRNDRWAMQECNKCVKCWASCPVKAIKIEVFDRTFLELKNRITRKTHAMLKMPD